jgi:hypothetical protein
MACAGIDQRGNIALGYSRSSAANNADIYWAERKKSDALSSLGTEQVFQTASGFNNQLLADGEIIQP